MRTGAVMRHDVELLMSSTTLWAMAACPAYASALRPSASKRAWASAKFCPGTRRRGRDLGRKLVHAVEKLRHQVLALEACRLELLPELPPGRYQLFGKTGTLGPRGPQCSQERLPLGVLLVDDPPDEGTHRC